jgi:hypothetical protein
MVTHKTCEPAGCECLPTHGRHWQMARYELPVKEVERKVGKRTVTDIIVGDEEKLAYVHKWTGKRVEFSRPRLDNTAAYLEEADAKWQCELAIAEANKQEKTCIVGFLDLSTVRTNEKIVAEWNQKAKDPAWCKWPTKLEGVPGAFGGRV